jgi:hypothetical protein
MPYADKWADAINETYTDPDLGFCGEDFDDEAVRRVLAKAADCLRNGETHTFTGDELDLIRHLMPAHEVHQSGAKRWVLENFGQPVFTDEDHRDNELAELTTKAETFGFQVIHDHTWGYVLWRNDHPTNPATHSNADIAALREMLDGIEWRREHGIKDD